MQAEIMLKNISSHLDDAQMNYPEHFIFAIGISSTLIYAGIACACHAILPNLFTTTASLAVNRLQDILNH
jgi:hypothetical protein|tara:strand:+ start:3730 stop:3939 length:210 start_codon:yes stop_codon:yes gene_type:complete